ncbi:hypothetical protein [Mycolicibacterium austroafricanum]|uniref:hypothetical protein n=1 Tax=Mycolicibacterium austroafricanum TaxID=39687 RepID=UPI000CF94C78|nr:hypothetical protein [Mycolicibacterium austroafricanum]PQP50685.1 hypothetical protein C6A88_09580 [Mycolicibacterium austroafricanum]
MTLIVDADNTFPTAGEEPTMGALTADLLLEIERHLQASPMRHGEIFRHMNHMTLEEMASRCGKSLSHIRNFKRSLDLLLNGRLPDPGSVTMAMTNSFVYRELKNFSCTTELERYVDARLRALKAINPNVNVNEPLPRRALQCTPARRAVVATRGPVRETEVCSECSTTRPCFCD